MTTTCNKEHDGVGRRGKGKDGEVLVTGLLDAPHVLLHS